MVDLKKVARSGLTKEIATRTSDPYFTSSLSFLPNPDPILRRLNKGQEAFDGIAMDAHVLGELRSIRSSLLGFEWRLQPGGESPQDARALELCYDVMRHRPAAGIHWSDVIWNMATAIFRGYSVHEVIWENRGGYILPEAILDRPQRRFLFGAENDLRLKTRTNIWNGVPIEDKRMLLTRHMPSQENPYGVAVFSACFWPYTFKHSGYRFWVKFAEKYGLPWAIGKYPEGIGKEEQNQLLDKLADMVEDAIAAIPTGVEVELVEAKGGKGEGNHERLIMSCNREMSKALTSQTLATEIQGQGSRAASETHRDREISVHESDRKPICDTFNQLFAWIVELNIPDAAPPRFEFWEEGEARQEWVEVLEGARKFMPVPLSFARERLQIPEARDGEDVLPAGERQAAEFNRPDGHSFAVPAFPDQVELERMLDSIDDQELQAQAEAMLEPLFKMVRQEGADEALGHLAEAYPDMDDDRLVDLLSRIIFVADAWGRLNA